MSAQQVRIRKIEEHLVNSWPSLRTVMCDGWLFREANGYTKRANSACALESRDEFLSTLDRAERFYAGAATPAIFRLSPLAPRDADTILADRGYRFDDETIVMTASLDAWRGHDAAVAISPYPTRDWEDGYAAAHALDAAARRAHRAILDRIAPYPTAFASVRENGKAIAFGLGVVAQDHLGLFDIVTVPEARRQGAARKLVQALMSWGKSRDAEKAWLSVIADNEKAKPLYADVGFAEAYRYHYRVAA